jgi:hypothetical protein
MASSQSGLKAQRRFYVKGNEGSVSGADYTYQLAFNPAVKQMLNHPVAPVFELLRQYPQLGLPSQEELAVRTPRGSAVRR